MISQSALDPDFRRQAAGVLGKLGRLHLPDFLEAGAARALFHAIEALPWLLMYRNGESPVETDLAEIERMAPQDLAALWRRINAQASTGFQYLYDKYRISECMEKSVACDATMTGFFQALNSEATLDYFRTLTGDRSIVYADAQATRYRSGHFLTVHHDTDAAYDRRYAYVLNLTPLWRPDWGGLLMFVGSDGHISEAYSPCWNALNVFKVPQPHAVSHVAPFAARSRYSITGWLRADKP